VGDDPALFASELSSIATAGEIDNLVDRRRALLDSALGSQARMREAMRNLNARFDKKIERSDALLAEALATAKTLP